MRKKIRKLGTICAGTFIVFGATVMADFFKEKRERRLVDAECGRSKKALLEFLAWNDLDPDLEKDIKYLSDSRYTPIYTYNGEHFQPEKMRIPKDYVLLKLKHTSGVVNYAYGLEWQKKDLFPNYHVLFYLEDEKEWKNDDELEDDSAVEEF